MSETLATLISTRLASFDAALAAAIPSGDRCVPERLSEAMEYSLLAGGKRVRPLLVMLGCESVRGEEVHALPAAVAIELIHTYSLIHDDLPAMDDDDLRRGRATCHKQFDEATAILAGDGLLTLAFGHIVDAGRGASLSQIQIADSISVLASAAGPAGMVGGQMADLEAESSPGIDDGALSQIHERKTGRLLSAAVVLGGIAGGASADERKRLDEFGSRIGLAFQITDDVLDETSDASTMGKNVQKDATRGKATYPRLIGLDESRRRADQLMREAIEIAHSFGEPGQHLGTVAEFVVRRDR